VSLTQESEHAHERCELLIETGRHAEALSLLHAQLAGDPDDAYAWMLVARAHLGLAQYDRALEAAGAVVRDSPNAVWGHLLASGALSGLGRDQEALAAARRCVELAPHLPAAHMQVAAAADKVKGQGQLAWDAASRATELAPLDPDTHAMMASVAISFHRNDIAERALLEALRLDPQHADARHDLGVVRLRQGNSAEAARSFVDAVRSDPSQKIARRNLDVVVLRWLQRTHLGLWLFWFLVRIPTELGPRGVAIGMWLLAVVVLGWWTRRTVLTLSNDVRSVVWRVLRSSSLASLWFGCVVLAGVAASVMVFVPSVPAREAAATVAGAALLVGCLASWVRVGLNRRAS